MQTNSCSKTHGPSEHLITLMLVGHYCSRLLSLIVHCCLALCIASACLAVAVPFSWFVIVWCLLIVVCCLFVACCLFVVCRLLFVDAVVVCCLLFVAH